MSIEQDCPICLTVVNGDTNKVITDCGHTFHCTCLMQNVSANGFACPCCRCDIKDKKQANYKRTPYQNSNNPINEITMEHLDEILHYTLEVEHERIRGRSESVWSRDNLYIPHSLDERQLSEIHYMNFRELMNAERRETETREAQNEMLRVISGRRARGRSGMISEIIARNPNSRSRYNNTLLFPRI